MVNSLEIRKLQDSNPKYNVKQNNMALNLSYYLFKKVKRLKIKDYKLILHPPKSKFGG